MTVHLGAKLGNGYLIPVDPAECPLTVHRRFLSAAENGDTIAQTALLNMGIALEDREFLRQQTGIWIFELDTANAVLGNGTYPATYQGKSWERLQVCAETSFITQRVLAVVAKYRLLNPNYRIKEVYE